MPRTVARTAFLLLSVFLIGSCDFLPTGDGDGDLIPTAIVLVSGGEQTGEVGQTLSDLIVVEVRDASGAPVPGITANLSIEAGGPNAAVSPTTVTSDASGRVQMTWTMGETAGPQTLRVTLPEHSVTFPVSVTAEPGPVAELTASEDTLRFASLNERRTVATTAVDRFGNVVTDYTPAWSTDAPAIATVDGGRVTSVGNGTTSVFATADNGAAEVVVEVEQVPASLSLSGASLLDAVGDTMRLTVTAADANHYAIETPALTWQSLEPGVATVASGGLVTAVATGTARVVVSGGELADTTAVDVVQRAAEVVVTPAADTVALGDTIRFEAQAFDALGNAMADPAIIWSSAQASLATVDTAGLATARLAGTATIRARVDGATGTATLVISAPEVVRVELEPANADLELVGDTVRLSALAYSADSTQVLTTIFWSTTDPAVASVDGGGLVTARGAGTGWVRARAGTVSDSARVRVGTATLPDSVDVTPDSLYFAALGDTASVDAAVFNMDAELIAGAELVWTVEDSTVATVAGGIVTSAGPGVTSLIGRSEDAADTIPLVVEQVMTALVVSPATDSVVLNGSSQFEATALDANAFVIPGADIVWSSLSPSVATVDETGLATAYDVPGTANLMAESGAFADTATLTVIDLVVDSVDVTPDADTLATVGETTQLSAVAYDTAGTLITLDVAYAWSSSDPAVATVNGDGLVTAQAGGEAWIYGSAGPARDSTRIHVQLAISSVTIIPDSLHFTLIEDSLVVTAELRDMSDNVVSQAVQWSIADTTIAALAGDTVVARSAGTTELVGTSGGAFDTIPVVVAPAVDSLIVLPDSLVMTAVGIVDSLTAFGYDNVGQLIPDAAFTWSAADTFVVRVDAEGLVTSRALGGTWVFASADGATDSAWVEVDQAPTSIVILSGDGQEGSAASQLPDSLVVQVLDAGGAVVAGAQVVWTGDGSFAPDTTTTGAGGEAWTYWTMPNDAGSFQATATVADSIAVSFQAGVGSLPGDLACESAGVTHTQHILTSETWAAAGSPHHVPGYVEVQPGAVLTVEPGAVVCFGSGAQIATLDGAGLSAQGTSTDTIVFTATNVANPWWGLSFYGTTGSSSLSYARIEHAYGNPLYTTGSHDLAVDNTVIRQAGMLYLDAGGEVFTSVLVDSSRYAGDAAIYIPWNTDSASFNGLTIRGAPTRGMDLYNADDVTLTDVTILDAGTEGIRITGGGQGVALTNVRIENAGGIGLLADPGTVDSVAGLRVVGGASYPAQVSVDLLRQIAPTPADQDSLLGNARDTLIVSGAYIFRDTVTVRADLPWRVIGVIALDTLSMLRVQPGAGMAFSPYTGVQTYNGGRVDAQGTADSVIVFTSTEAPTAGGVNPEPWYGFDLHGVSWAPATSTVRHALFEYTDGDALYARDYHDLIVEDTRLRQGGGIHVRDPGAQIRRVVVDTAVAATRGLYVYDADSTVVEDLTVRSSPQRGVNIYYSRGTSLTNIRIEGSGTEGLFIEGNEPVTLDTIDILDSGTTGLFAYVGSVASSTGLRVQGSAEYGANIGLDVLAKIAPTVELQDSLLGNGRDTLVINGGAIYYDTLYARPDLPWRVSGSATVDTLSLLKVLPGTELAFQPYTYLGFSHGGHLDAQGTADSVITFTNTNKPTLSQPTPEYWYGLDFYGVSWAPTTSTVRHALLEYTDGDALYARDYHDLVVEDTRVRKGGGVQVREPGSQIRRLVVDSATAGTRGLYVYDADSTVVEDVTVRSSPDVGVYVYYSAGTSLTNIWIEGSAGRGLYLQGSEPVTLDNIDILDSGSTGLYAWSGSVESATGIRVQGGAHYGADIGLDVLAKIAPTAELQDSLLGNGRDTLVINGGSIYFDTVYARPDLPWRVTGYTTVDTLSVVKVLPGTELAFQPYTGLNFINSASLDAQGTADSVITFTGTDKPTLTQPTPEPWYGVDLNGVSWAPTASTIRHSLFEYTDGVSIHARDYHSLTVEDTRLRKGGGIQVEQPASAIRRVVVDTATNASYGLRVYDADSTVVEDVTLRASPVHGINVYYSGATTITGALIEHSGDRGLFLQGSEPVALADVRILNSGGIGFFADPGSVSSSTGLRVQGSGQYGARMGLDVLARVAPTAALQDSLLGNTQDTLLIIGGSLYRDTVFTRTDLPWRVDGSIGVDTMSQLVVAPGSRLSFGPSISLSLDRGGSIDARGKADSLITFTTTVQPTLSQPIPSPWGGISFRATASAPATSYFKNAVIEYASGVGSSGGPHAIQIDSTLMRHSGTLYISTSGSSVQHSVVDSSRVSSGGYAVYLNASADTTLGKVITFYGNVVRGSNQHGLFTDETSLTATNVTYSEITGNNGYGVRASTPTPSDWTQVESCNIHDNANVGLYYSGTYTLYAENNWWGDAGGPTGPNGDGVSAPSGTISYDPWLSSPVTIPDNPWWP